MWIKFIRNILIVFLLLELQPSLYAQRGLGFRFSAGFNHFFRPEQMPLIDGSWSNLVIGPYYQAYFSNGGLQVGVNLVYKNSSDRGFPNLPLIMKDLKGDANVGVTALEMDFKVGPRFNWFNPKIGYILGYRFVQDGFLENDTMTNKINRVYLNLPFAASAQFPTDYGSVGFGISYDVGLSNVLVKPKTDPPILNYNGSRMRTFKAELTIMFSFRRQAPKPEPIPE